MTTVNRNPPEAGQVAVSISEPWGFESEVGTGLLHGRVIASDRESNGQPAILIQLASPVLFGGAEFNGLLASGRYEGQPVTNLVARTSVVCNFAPVRIDPDIGGSWARLPVAHLIGAVEAVPEGDE